MVVASTWADCATSARLCSGCRPMAGAHVPELDVEVEGGHPAGEAHGERRREVGGDGGLAGAALGRHHDDDLARLRLGRRAGTRWVALTETGSPARRSATVVLERGRGVDDAVVHHFTTV